MCLMQSTAVAEVTIDHLVSRKAISSSGDVCFNSGEIKSIANFKKRCDEDKENLDIFSTQYSKCLNGELCEESLANSTVAFWAATISALIIGFSIGAGSR